MLGVAYYFASLQGLLSSTVAMSKPDIRRAVLNLLCCRPDEFNETEAGFLGSRVQKLGKSIMPSKFFSSRNSSTRFSTGGNGVSKEFDTSAAMQVSEYNSAVRDSQIVAMELREETDEDLEEGKETSAMNAACADDVAPEPLDVSMSNVSTQISDD
ncbi:MAG: hypothetical protein SGARI_006119 [Bacillariaceae sp.]